MPSSMRLKFHIKINRLIVFNNLISVTMLPLLLFRQHLKVYKMLPKQHHWPGADTEASA